MERETHAGIKFNSYNLFLTLKIGNIIWHRLQIFKASYLLNTKSQQLVVHYSLHCRLHDCGWWYILSRPIYLHDWTFAINNSMHSVSSSYSCRSHYSCPIYTENFWGLAKTVPYRALRSWGTNSFRNWTLFVLLKSISLTMAAIPSQHMVKDYDDCPALDEKLNGFLLFV